MFGIIADLIASVTTILFPTFASYKALRGSDPAQLAPWLIYWVILSLILLVESWTVFIIGWLPFYSWIRLITLSYLVLPQTQGAKMLYFTYVEPFIVDHEQEIEVFIGKAHERATALGMGYMQQIIDLIRERLLNMPPAAKESPSAPATAGAAGYAQSLISRFSMPAARSDGGSSASDFYGLLSGAVTAATSSGAGIGRSRDIQAEEISASGTLFPNNVRSDAEKMTFISSQRDKLGLLMRALDKEQQNLDLAYGAPAGSSSRSYGSGQGHGQPERYLEADIDRRMRDTSGEHPGVMKKNRSDQSFEAIEHDDIDYSRRSGPGSGSRPGSGPGSRTTTRDDRDGATRRTTSGGWIPTGWFSGAPGDEGAGPTADSVRRGVDEVVRGLSSGYDRSR